MLIFYISDMQYMHVFLHTFLEQFFPYVHSCWPVQCSASLSQLQLTQKHQHLILGSLLFAECLTACPWGKTEKSVQTSSFRVKTHFFVRTELNQLFLAHNSSKIIHFPAAVRGHSCKLLVAWLHNRAHQKLMYLGEASTDTIKTLSFTFKIKIHLLTRAMIIIYLYYRTSGPL